MAGAALSSCPIQIPGLNHKNPLHRPVYGGSAPSHKSETAAGGAGKARAYAGDHFATLGISPGTSKQEIKSAYRRLALQYHPDVCKDEQSAHKFKQIKSAYECAMNAAASPSRSYMDECYFDSSSITWEGLMGVNDDSWEEWEEWMGWEGAGIRDYTSHINIHQ